MKATLVPYAKKHLDSVATCANMSGVSRKGIETTLTLCPLTWGLPYESAEGSSASIRDLLHNDLRSAPSPSGSLLVNSVYPSPQTQARFHARMFVPAQDSELCSGS